MRTKRVKIEEILDTQFLNKSYISLENNLLFIDTPCWNWTNFTYTMNILVMAYIIAMADELYLTLIAILGIVVGLYYLWTSLRAANFLVIDADNRFILVKSKNPLKRYIDTKIFNDQRKFAFDEINTFYDDWSNNIHPGERRYLVKMKATDDYELVVTDFSSETEAESFSNNLNMLLR